ncbi:unnamed protein product, partial [Amoebophrya sp. A25]
DWSCSCTSVGAAAGGEETRKRSYSHWPRWTGRLKCFAMLSHGMQRVQTGACAMSLMLV